MAEIKITKVNWVICPKCNYRYYVGASLLVAEGIPAMCPRCHHEFDAKEHLDKKLIGGEVTVANRFY